MHGSAPGSGVGHGVGRCGKGHRIIRAVAVEVSRRAGESACPVRSESALDRRAIIRIIETGSTECVVTYNIGRAICRGVRLFHGPRADRACTTRGVELDELG